nr:hypothetical protein [Brevundimonas diminuta]
MADTPRVTVPVEDLLFYKLKDLILEQSEGEWTDEMIVRDAHHFANHIRPLLSAAPAPEGGAVMKACADFQEAIDYFEADVADAMAEESERADLWDREVTVNIDALKVVMRAALATREEAPANTGECPCNLKADDCHPDCPHGREKPPAHAFVQSHSVTSEGGCKICGRDKEAHEAPAEAGEDAEAVVRRWANWIIDESSDMDHDDHDAGRRKVRAERDLILSALRAQPPAREDAQPVAKPAPFDPGGIGHAMFQAFHDYRADYVLSTDGADYEPTLFERNLIEDFFCGLMAEEAFFGPIRALYSQRRLFAEPEPKPVQSDILAAPDALREANLWWNAEDWEQTFNSLEDAYDEATGGEMRGVAKLGRATEHDPVWALRIDFDTTGDGEADDYEIRLFKSVDDAHAYLAALQAEQGAK